MNTEPMKPSEPVAQETSAKKQRSSSYPRYGLEHAIAFAKAVDDLGSDRVSKASLVAQTGMPINSSAFLGRVSSTKQFGLIAVDGDNVSITSRTNRILHAVSEEDKNLAMAEALAEPKLYANLVKRFNGKNLPTSVILGNVLMNDPENGIEKKACAAAANTFLQSAQYAGCVQNGMLVVLQSNQSPEETEVSDETEPLIPMSAPIVRPPLEKSSATPFVDKNVWSFNYAGGIQLIIPKSQKVDEAISDGELKAAKDSLISFAKKFLMEEES